MLRFSASCELAMSGSCTHSRALIELRGYRIDSPAEFVVQEKAAGGIPDLNRPPESDPRYEQVTCARAIVLAHDGWK